MNTPLLDTSLQLPVQNRFGAVAIKQGLLTSAQLQEAVRVQRAAAKAGLRKRLGEILIKKGYLTPNQVRNIMAHQSVESDQRQIGNYELLAKLGQGGMGMVFKARQVSLNRLVALKVLSAKLAQEEEYRKRFLHEARAVARLDHPNIVNAIDVGFADEVFYFAMEYVDGESLGQILVDSGGRISEEDALQYLEQIALALQHAHQHGLLHRDVKPDNILIKKNGVAKLADLGLVRPRRQSKTVLGDRGIIVGTPYYISPEQAKNEKLSPSSDFYSLGASLFHLLTGRPPFTADNSPAIMARHCTEPAPDPSELNPNLSVGTVRICMKLMEKDPRKRYRDGKTLAEDLKQAREDLVPNPVSVREGTTKIKGKGVRKRGGRTRTRGRTTAVTRKKRMLRHFTRRSADSGFAGILAIVLVLTLLAAIFFLFAGQ